MLTFNVTQQLMTVEKLENYQKKVSRVTMSSKLTRPALWMYHLVISTWFEYLSVLKSSITALVFEYIILNSVVGREIVRGNILNIGAKSTWISPTKRINRNDWSAMMQRCSRQDIFKTLNLCEYRNKDTVVPLLFN